MSVDYRSLWESAGGVVPKHWKFITIEALLEHPKSISVGVMYPGSNTLGGTPLVKVSDVKNGAIAVKPDFCISKNVDDEYKRSRLNGSELLLTLVGNPGDCVIVTEDMAGWNAARALAVIRLSDIELRSWIRYVLLSKPAKHLIDARLNTTVQKTLNLKDVKELSLPVPSKVEREEITKIIDVIESKLLLNRQTNQTLEQIAQAIFKSWFVDFEPTRAKIKVKESWLAAHQSVELSSPTCYAEQFDNQHNISLQEAMNRAAMAAISGAVPGCTNVAGGTKPGATKTKAELNNLPADILQQLRTTAELFPDTLVESELGEIPEGWEVKALDDIAHYQNGLALQKFRPKGEEPFLPVLKISQLKKGFADAEEKATASIKPECVVDDGDVIFSWSGSLLVDVWCGGKVALNQHLFKVTSQNNPKWFYYYYWTKYHLKMFQQIAADKAVTMGHIKREHLSQAKCVIPNCDIDSFGVFSDLLEKQIEQRVENFTLEQLRDTLLPKLLSGELSLADTDSQAMQ
ncbi:MAG: type I restriction endonuclease subunit S [Piscirickettsiaceae bacterium]|nr:MAG: type I restriction endonuclease subunit S [Piscirickettsiaceae bacterium]